MATPDGTIIPGWAQIDPTKTGSWNATAAEEYAGKWTTIFYWPSIG